MCTLLKAHEKYYFGLSFIDAKVCVLVLGYSEVVDNVMRGGTYVVVLFCIGLCVVNAFQD